MIFLSFTYLEVAVYMAINEDVLNHLVKLTNDTRFRNGNHLCDVYECLINNQEETMFIDYILDKQKEDETVEVKALAHCETDDSHICEIELDSNGHQEYGLVPDWDYNCDSYLLADLEDGYSITYMPLESHAGHWCNIHEYDAELEYTKGLQIYLSYCKLHGITQELLSTVHNDIPNISNMYQEVNHGYQIVAEVTVGQKAIALGHNNKAPQPYVTWITTPTRKRGFDQGHYFSDYKSAVKDLTERCHEVMNVNIRFQKEKSRHLLNIPKEKGYER